MVDMSPKVRMCHNSLNNAYIISYFGAGYFIHIMQRAIVVENRGGSHLRKSGWN